jgi:hypothetical protein
MRLLLLITGAALSLASCRTVHKTQTSQRDKVDRDRQETVDSARVQEIDSSEIRDFKLTSGVQEVDSSSIGISVSLDPSKIDSTGAGRLVIEIDDDDTSEEDYMDPDELADHRRKKKKISITVPGNTTRLDVEVREKRSRSDSLQIQTREELARKSRDSARLAKQLQETEKSDRRKSEENKDVKSTTIGGGIFTLVFLSILVFALWRWYKRRILLRRPPNNTG